MKTKYTNVLFALTMQCAVRALDIPSVRADPLQPIWDSLELFPAKVLDELQRALSDHKATLTSAIDEKIANLQNDLNAQSIPTREHEDISSVKKPMTDALTIAFEDVYNAKIRDENKAVLFYDNNTIVSLRNLEDKVVRHLDQTLRKADFLFEFNNTIENGIFDVSYHATTMLHSVTSIKSRVTYIQETLFSNRLDTCDSVGDDLQQFIEEKQPTEQRLREFENQWDATYEVVVGDLPRILYHRDCSDILSSDTSAKSGVYDIYPSRDLKRKVSVWCHMEATKVDYESGGWTVMLRRRNTSAGFLNFNRTWEEYSAGFGKAAEEGEWWLGLTWIHELTYYEPYEVLFLLEDIEHGKFYAHYNTFRVEDEARDFSLIVDGYSGTVDDAFKAKHHGQSFSTPDRDNDKCDTCSCAVNNQGGWWFNVCHWTVLTAPFPTSNDRKARTIKWLSGQWQVLVDVTIMIKRTSYR